MLLKNVFFALVVMLGVMCLAQVSAAAEKCRVASFSSATGTEYLAQHILEVDDVPGHQVRIFKIRRKVEDPVENCEGLKEVESISWGYSDYTEGNGAAWGYVTTVFDNGDKMYAEWHGISLLLTLPEGEATNLFTGTRAITGGTGVYKGVRGTGRGQDYFNPDTGYNEGNHIMEYRVSD